MSDIDNTHSGLIAWFARNSVAANLLMFLIIALGFYSANNINKEMMPKFESNFIQVIQPYPGAAPAEVEQGIVLKIEESLKDVDGIKRIESHAYESVARIMLEVLEGEDLSAVMNEVKIAIDGISSFPQQAEKPVIEKLDMVIHALQLQLYGNIDERSGKKLAEEIKAELLANTEAGKVNIYGVRELEVTIEVPERQLQRYGLTLNQVAERIRAASVDLPAGAIKTQAGQILLRTQGQARDQQEFESIVLLTRADGTRLLLGDVATVVDGFEEQRGFAAFNGTYSVGMPVYTVGDQDVIKVAESVKEYLVERRKTLPEGVYLDYWIDLTHYLDERLSMMLKNLLMGVLLVLITLSIFMEIKIAFWVMLGLPLSFLGAFVVLPLEMVNVTVNMMSLFGFILVLGIVVDDAIIIGESVHSETRRNGHSVDSVIRGAKRVALPATFGVLTTICAFMPTLFIPGAFANLPAAFGYVVIFCLLFSLVESKWILPAHLVHMNKGFSARIHSNWQDNFQQRNNARLEAFVSKHYQPFLQRAIGQRYTTLAIFVAMLILIGGMVGGGWIRYVMVHDTPMEYVEARLEMARGTPDYKTNEALQFMAAELYRLDETHKQQFGEGFLQNAFSYGQDGRIGVFLVELTPDDQRAWTVKQIADRWRDKVGPIPGARTQSFTGAGGPDGADLALNLVAKNRAQLNAAAAELEAHLREIDGVYDIRNGAGDVVSEIHIDIKPGAQALGLTLAEVGMQVREAFYGAEAQRIQRGNDEVKVMVRYPQTERKTVADLENMYIRTRAGTEVPILSVAELTVRPAAAEIARINREPAILVTGMVNKDSHEPNLILKEIKQQFMPKLMAKYPSVSYRLDGMSLEVQKLEVSLLLGFGLALFGIYALLAIPLKSYSQPLIIMSVIPFGIIGAAIGHLVLGLAIDMMSIFGLIALSGVVVNDSLIMVDFVNRAIASGEPLVKAVVGAGAARFRAILLTSLTTFFGILPMLVEPSVQAQFFVPMAVSLGFGIVFATIITLVLVPCLYVILGDFNLLPAVDPELLDDDVTPVGGSAIKAPAI